MSHYKQGLIFESEFAGTAEQLNLDSDSQFQTRDFDTQAFMLSRILQVLNEINRKLDLVLRNARNAEGDILELRDIPVKDAMEEIKAFIASSPDGVDYDDIINELKIDIPIVVEACDKLRSDGAIE